MLKTLQELPVNVAVAKQAPLLCRLRYTQPARLSRVIGCVLQALPCSPIVQPASCTLDCLILAVADSPSTGHLFRCSSYIARNSATHSFISSNATHGPEACRNIYSVRATTWKVQSTPSRAERTRDGGKREIPEKTRQPTASSSTIPTCENPATWPGIEPGSPWRKASVLDHSAGWNTRRAPSAAAWAALTHSPGPRVRTILRRPRRAVLRVSGLRWPSGCRNSARLRPKSVGALGATETRASTHSSPLRVSWCLLTAARTISVPAAGASYHCGA
ncbi:hypothetical protein PR048_028714 [Dryococelus australis]|uniref:Uncharacterized protein n=1 Tax=Dryococelus australis TaxID=614101 RepID=A0ABQ9GBC3_9NEOP|nr:hypothetical protein PR048_028714 [Dryococelus australis]